MSKKNFQSGLDNLFQTENSENDKEIQTKNKSSLIRATFIVDKQQIETIKALAYWERKNIKELVFEAFNLLLNNRDKDKMDIAKKEYYKK